MDFLNNNNNYLGFPFEENPLSGSGMFNQYTQNIQNKNMYDWLQSQADTQQKQLGNTTQNKPQKEGQKQTQQLSGLDKSVTALSQVSGLVMPSSLENSARRAGQALAFDPNAEFIGNKGQAKTGKTLSLIGNIGRFTLGAARSLVNGMAEENLYQQQVEAMQRKIAEANEGMYEQLEQGGTVGEFKKTVEVEDGEFIRTPDGKLVEVKGNTHEDGGEIVSLEMLSEITSNNLQVGNSGISKINEMYPDLKLKLRPTDTYADVIRKAEDKLRLKDLDIEIDNNIKQLNNLNIDDDKTSDFVKNYLTNKGTKLEKKKEALENIKLDFADSIFSLQEETKGTDKSYIQDYYANGGTISDETIEYIKSNTGLPTTFINQLMRKNQLRFFEQFKDGGEVGDKFIFNTVYNKFRKADDVYSYQRYTPNDYGILTSGDVTKGSYQDRLNEMLRIFPKLDQYFDVKYNDDGSVQSATPKSKESVKEAQKYQQRVYDNHLKFADEFIKNEDERKQYKDLITSFRFDPDNEESVRFFDNKLGDFTSSRSITELELMTEDERKMLANKGIDRFTKAFENGKLKDLGLSDDTKNKFNQIYKLYGDDFEAGFLANQERPKDASKPTETPKEEKTPNNPNSKAGISDLKLSGLGKRPFIPPILPNQYRDDWDNIAAHLKVDTTYGRLGYDRIDDSKILESIYQSQNISQGVTNGMTDAQRLAVQSDIIAKSQAAINQAQLETSTRNRLMENEIDKFNVGQRDREVDANNINLLDFEKRQYTAKEITDANNTTIRNHNRKVATSDYATLAKLRNIHNMFDNYGVDMFGGITPMGNGSITDYLSGNLDKIRATQAVLQAQEQATAERIEALNKGRKTTK